MPQSAKAMLAMFIFSILVLTQQRTSVQAEVTVVQNTVSVLANGIAVERLEQVASLGFDQATVDNISIDSPSALTAVNSFGPSEDKAGDDMDDYDATSVTLWRGVGADTLTFVAETEVYYVSESDPEAGIPSADRTRYKKIDVAVYNLDVSFADTVRLTRIESCKSSCQW